jgi:hypothetical protein
MVPRSNLVVAVVLMTGWMAVAVSATAQRPAVATGFEHDPRWALGNSLIHAPISKQFKRHIMLDLTGDAAGRYTDDNVGTYTMVYAYTIPASAAGPARRLLRVWGGGDSCGATGNCTILIYDASTGAKLLEQEGWDFEFLRARHFGARDVRVMDKTGPCDVSRTILRYDGTRYVRLKSGPVPWC